MAKKDDEVFINLIVEKIAPDRTDYKQYGLSFIPHKTMVSIPVSAKEVSVVYQKDVEGNDTENADVVVLTLDGLMQVTGQIADSIDDLHNKHIKYLQTGEK